MDRWWRAHRDTSDLFARELASVLACIAVDPTMGTIYGEREGVPIRRVLLPKTRSHVYYEVDDAAGIVMILAVWGAPRGRGPKL